MERASGNRGREGKKRERRRRGGGNIPAWIFFMRFQEDPCVCVCVPGLWRNTCSELEMCPGEVEERLDLAYRAGGKDSQSSRELD